MTPRLTKVLPIQTNASFAKMSNSSIQNFSLDWKIYVKESYFSSVSISVSQCHMCKMYIFQESLSHIAEKARIFVTVTPLSQIARKKENWFCVTYTWNVGWWLWARIVAMGIISCAHWYKANCKHACNHYAHYLPPPNDDNSFWSKDCAFYEM